MNKYKRKEHKVKYNNKEENKIEMIIFLSYIIDKIY